MKYNSICKNKSFLYRNILFNQEFKSSLNNVTLKINRSRKNENEESAHKKKEHNHMSLFNFNKSFFNNNSQNMRMNMKNHINHKLPSINMNNIFQDLNQAKLTQMKENLSELFPTSTRIVKEEEVNLRNQRKSIIINYSQSDSFESVNYDKKRQKEKDNEKYKEKLIHIKNRENMENIEKSKFINNKMKINHINNLSDNQILNLINNDNEELLCIKKLNKLKENFGRISSIRSIFLSENKENCKRKRNSINFIFNNKVGKVNNKRSGTNDNNKSKCVEDLIVNNINQINIMRKEKIFNLFRGKVNMN